MNRKIKKSYPNKSKRYSTATKANAVRDFQNGTPISEVCTKYNIRNSSSLYQWRDAVRTSTPTTSNTTSNTTSAVKHGTFTNQVLADVIADVAPETVLKAVVQYLANTSK